MKLDVKLFAIIFLPLILFFTNLSYAQQITAEITKTVPIEKGADPRLAKKKLQQLLDTGVIRNLLETSFAVKITPAVEAKLPDLIDLLSGSIQYSYEPSDGLDLKGRAKLTVATAKLTEILRNKEIGSGDIAAKRSTILVSIDEYVGVATQNSGSTPNESKVTFSSDKSSFSDTSSKSAGSQSESESSYNKKDVAYASKDTVAVAGKSSSAVAARQDTAVAGRQDTAVAGRQDTAVARSNGYGSAAGAQSTQYAGAQSTQYAGAQSTQVAAAQSSQYAGAASSEKAYSDKSVAASSASSQSAFNNQQNNIQQKTDKVSYTIETKMPDFNNAKPMSKGVLGAKLGAEFIANGLELASESTLRSEGGQVLTIDTITKNGRIDYFKEQIKKRGLNADVWARGSANYNILGTVGSQTSCNGSLFVESDYIETNKVFFNDSLTAKATGQGDQECIARLGIALASSLAKSLAEQATKALQAKSSRGNAYTLYLYSASSLSRGDRSTFTEVLKAVDGIKYSDPLLKDYYMAMEVQLSGDITGTLDKILSQLEKADSAWKKSDFLTKDTKICIGLEGKGACPQDFR
jgi:hypothetical protein